MCLVLFLSMSLVAADTIIGGKIYNADFSETVAGASVEVTCNGNVKTTTSLSDGAYSVIYSEDPEDESEYCDNGHALSVYASNPDYGSNTVEGIIHNNVVFNIDVGIVNVPLVPEFGMIVGALTIISAIGVFFFVRRE